MTSADGTSTEPDEAKPKKAKRDQTHWLYIAVIVAVVAGIVVGLVAPDAGSVARRARHAVRQPDQDDDRPGHLLHRSCSGIGSVRKAASVGKVGGLALAYFLVMSTVALAIGLVVGNLISPGTGLNIASDPAARVPSWPVRLHASGGTMEFISDIIPTSLFSSLTEGNVLQALFVALLVGFALQAMGARGEPMLRGIETVQKLVFKILIGILWLAPIGAFGAIAEVVGDTGFDAVIQLGVLMGAFYLTCADLRLRRPRSAAADRRADLDLQAGPLPGPRVPADRRDLVVGVGAAAADRQDGARRCQAGRPSASSCRPATRSTSTAPRST